MERMLAFAGIDVGGAENTYVSVLIMRNGSLTFKKVEYSDGISGIAQSLSSLSGCDVVSCAIDAPLSYDISSRTGDRKSDRKLRELLENPSIVMPLNSMMAVPLRGRIIAEILRGFIGAVIETHPTASLYLMGVDEEFVKNYKKEEGIIGKLLNQLIGKIESLTGLQFKEEDEVKTDGDVDSLVCALTAYLFINDTLRLLKLTEYSLSERGYAPFYVVRGEF